MTLFIGITQRIDAYPSRNEKRDALDQEWSRLLWSLDIVPIPLSSCCSSNLNYLNSLRLDGFILSGGNDVGEFIERDRLETEILNYAKLHELPVLGVCRGMQFLNIYLGGEVRVVHSHVSCSHILYGPFAKEYGIKYVNSFHKLGITKEDLGSELDSLAFTQDGVIEAVRHKTLQWLGIMWHPERNSPFSQSDREIIQSHFGV